MKNFFYLICLAIAMASCASGKKGGSAVRHPPPATPAQPAFLENIHTNPSASPHAADNRPPVTVKGRSDLPGSLLSRDIERCGSLQFKYAILMEEAVEEVTDQKLVSFLEDWYGIPYKYGGATRMGIDCSAFSSLMMDSVYQLDIPRTCREQYSAGRRIKKSQLMQGDLVFFNTTGSISHVGVYLGHNKFVHASTSSGVMISDLEETYFRRRYVGSVRVR